MEYREVIIKGKVTRLPLINEKFKFKIKKHRKNVQETNLQKDYIKN